MRETERDYRRHTRLALGLVAVMTTLLAGCSSILPPPTRTPTPRPVAQVVTQPSPPPAPSVTPTSASTATPTPHTVVVANTGGEGVYIRRTATAADKVKAWPDNTPMIVVGPDQQAEGRVWKNVTDPAGNTGWVPAEYLSTSSAQPTASAPLPPAPTVDRSRYKLEVLGWTQRKQDAFAIVEGEVKNISAANLRNVVAVMYGYSSSGKLIKSESAFVAANPLLPGQTAPFKVMTADNADMVRVSITFRELLGDEISALDSRRW